MRDLFPGYYELTQEELEELWAECIFVFDANVLLDLYRWSDDTREDMLRVLRRLAAEGRLWLPHQAGLEYHRNRPQVIADAAHAYDPMLKDIAGQRRSLKEQFKSEQQPHVGSESIEKWHHALEELEAELKERRSGLHSLKSEDPVRETIEDVFDGNVGPPFEADKLVGITDEGRSRYQRLTPPGYEDADYCSGCHGLIRAPFGDLIIWFQIIQKAEQEEKPVIFVTSDLKGDWWWMADGERLGPRPELVAEIREQAGVGFHMYTPRDFLTEVDERLEIEVEEETINEVGRYEAAVPYQQLVTQLGMRQTAINEALRAAPQIQMPDITLGLRAQHSAINEAIRAATHIRLPDITLGLHGQQAAISEAIRVATQIRLPDITLGLRAQQSAINEAIRAATQIRLPDIALGLHAQQAAISEAIRVATQIRLADITLGTRAQQAAIKEAIRAATQIRLADIAKGPRVEEKATPDSPKTSGEEPTPDTSPKQPDQDESASNKSDRETDVASDDDDTTSGDPDDSAARSQPDGREEE